MTLNKHPIQGITSFSRDILDSNKFEKIMINAGYSMSGSAPAQGNRLKVWWIHSDYERVESIYSANKKLVITAYHVG